MQQTLAAPLTFRGTGLHSGAHVRLTLMPAAPDTGIVFHRTDLSPEMGDIPARWDFAIQEPLNTRIENENGASVSTIEHVMAALNGCGVHNARLLINGPEVPILDGSSAPFVAAILDVGVVAQAAPLKVIEVLKPVRVERGEAWASLSPAPTLEIGFEIDFPDVAIGHQEKQLDMANGAFVRELSDSRTFCRKADVDAMREAGLALGGTYENAIVVDGAQVLTPGGLRHRDEAVRHKMLDVMGDLYTAGAPLLARYDGHRAGHALTNALLRALFADPSAWRMRNAGPDLTAKLPGAHVHRSDLRLEQKEALAS